MPSTMAKKRKPLSFNDAVRVGARVPLLFSMLVLVFLASATTSFWPYVNGAVRGAPIATVEELSSGRMGPVLVAVSRVVPATPLTAPTSIRVVESGEQLVAVIGTSPAALERLASGAKLWGRLRPMTRKETETLQLENSVVGISSDTGIPHLVLVTNFPTRRHVLGLVVIAGLAGLAACGVIARSIRMMRNPLRSPVGRSLALFGEPSAVRAAFDGAMAEEHPIVGGLHGPKGFIAFRGRSGYTVVPRADVIWVRQRPGPDPVFLSVLAAPLVLFRSLLSRPLYVHERSGTRLRIPLSSRYERAAIIRELETLCPHTILVDDRATRKFWREHRSLFIARVDARRIELEQYLAGAITSPSTFSQPPV